MSSATVRIPAPLRSFTGGADEIRVEGGTVRDLLLQLGERHAGLSDRLLASDGSLRRFVNVFVGDKNVRSLQGLATPVEDGAVVSILPAVAGGSRLPTGKLETARSRRPSPASHR